MDAFSQGIIEQRSDDHITFLLDTMKKKDDLKRLGVEFDENEEIVGPDGFLDDLLTIYSQKSPRH